MLNIPKRQPNAFENEQLRLLDHLESLDPEGPEYEIVMKRLDHLNKIHNRTTEFVKTVIPALGTVASVAGIYALQQFAGVIVPKALDSIASRSTQKNSQELD